jgi:hypothetical protein
MGDNGYALDLSSPVRHVATEMDRAAGAALSISELAASYRHAIPGDLARIKLHEGSANDDEATAWLIGRAVKEITYQGKTTRSRVQVIANGDGYRLADGVTFDDLRYQGQKLHRAFAEGEEDARRALRAVYNDLNAERAFYVTVAGARGGSKEMRLRLHPLAHAIPQVSEKDFFELAADVKRHGVRNPIIVFDGQVLDGRHRLAIASALKVPLRVMEFEGDETAARDEVISQNVQRRHLTIAQRALIVQELFLPQAEAEAKARQGARTDLASATSTPDGAEVFEPDRAGAIERAAAESNGLATARTLQRMAPVRDAPQTQERFRRGENKSSTEARREALKETGRDEPEDAPVLQPKSAFENLGAALGNVRDACGALQRGSRGSVTDEQLISRINEIRAGLDRAEKLIHPLDRPREERGELQGDAVRS